LIPHVTGSTAHIPKISQWDHEASVIRVCEAIIRVIVNMQCTPKQRSFLTHVTDSTIRNTELYKRVRNNIPIVMQLQYLQCTLKELYFLRHIPKSAVSMTQAPQRDRDLDVIRAVMQLQYLQCALKEL
jgi:hypothetical protein